ncbi:hypothetical protein F5Y18DRAFT_427872 [Xylariaceae sp. FL1019]|nr:hypothetical protein F5Y18DRAFT_427872 [Xylariaceae sp. FL1019]
MSPVTPDYYFTLGVSPNACKNTLKRAYLGLIKPTSPTTLHVRRNEDDSDEDDLTPRQVEAREAYKFLADDKKRAAYNMTYPQLKAAWDAERLTRARRRASHANADKQALALRTSQNRAQSVLLSARARRSNKIARRLNQEKFVLEQEKELNDHSIQFHDLNSTLQATQENMHCRFKDLAREEEELLESLRHTQLRLEEVKKQKQNTESISNDIQNRLVNMATDNEILAISIDDLRAKLDADEFEFDDD